MIQPGLSRCLLAAFADATDAAHQEKLSSGDYKSFFDLSAGDMAKWSFGHPAAVVLDPQTLLLAWYAGVDETRLSLRWARYRV